MTFKQRLLKLFYPIIMRMSGASEKVVQMIKNENRTPAPVSFYSLRSPLNDGEILDFSTLKGKKVLLVNTASNCGYTAQYGQLETLYQQYKDSLVVIAFPANDFKEQERGTDGAIAEFCRVNYGIDFPLMKKSSVVKGHHQNPVFQWLTHGSQNGWNDQAPVWNFCKYLVDEQGVLTHYFAMTVSPERPELIAAITGKAD